MMPRSLSVESNKGISRVVAQWQAFFNQPSLHMQRVQQPKPHNEIHPCPQLPDGGK